MEAGLHLIAERLDVPAAVLFAPDSDGSLRAVAAVGASAGPAALDGLAEVLGGTDLLDVSGAIEGARFAAGARLGDGEGALLVLAPDDRQPDEAWHAAFAEAAHAALGLIHALGGRVDLGRILHEVAAHPGSFDDRLALALQRVVETTGLDAAAFAWTDSAAWTPYAVFDPSGRLLPTLPVPIGETVCSITSQADGPLALHDVVGAGIASTVGAYIGAPVFEGGRCVGTLCAVGAEARKPFTDADRALVDALARWAGSGLGGRETARQLADREAVLEAFFDAAPLGMGVATFEGGEADLVVVAMNATGAAALGATPETLVGRRAVDLGLGWRVGVTWADACRASLADGQAHRVEVELNAPDGLRTLATTVSPILDASGAPPRFALVVEDVTERRRADARLYEHDVQIEALLSQAPVALFATDAAGLVTAARGLTLTQIGLVPEETFGRALADLFPQAADAIRTTLDGADATWTVESGCRVFEVRVQPRIGRDGLVEGLIGVALDVTDRARAAAASEAAAAIRADLLSRVNHAFRSPLTAVIGFAELLSEDDADVTLAREGIARGTQRLLRALDDLLDLALLDDLATRPSPTEVGALVADVIEAERASAGPRLVRLCDGLAPGPVLLDRELLERVLRHLVGAALASAEGEVEVRLAPVPPDAFEVAVLGGGSGVEGVGAASLRRLVAVLGGTVEAVGGALPGWAVRLPRREVPVVDLGDGAATRPRAVGSAGRSGEAPAVALGWPAG